MQLCNTFLQAKIRTQNPPLLVVRSLLLEPPPRAGVLFLDPRGLSAIVGAVAPTLTTVRLNALKALFKAGEPAALFALAANFRIKCFWTLMQVLEPVFSTRSVWDKMMLWKAEDEFVCTAAKRSICCRHETEFRNIPTYEYTKEGVVIARNPCI